MGEIASKVEKNRGRKGLPRGGETTRFQRGRQKTGGRKKGTLNRFTRDVREALIEAVNRFGRDGKGDEGMVGYLLGSCGKERRAILSMLSKAMPSLVNVKEVEHAKFLTYEQARERLISSGVPAPLLDHLHSYTPGDVEKIQREAVEEAARRRQAMINGEAVEGNYEEVVE